MPEVIRGRKAAPRFTTAELSAFVALTACAAVLVGLVIGYFAFRGPRVVEDDDARSALQNAEAEVRLLRAKLGSQQLPDQRPSDATNALAPAHDPGWTNPGDANRIGNIEVRVEDVRIGEALLHDSIRNSDALSAEPAITIMLSALNVSDSKKVGFDSWGDSTLTSLSRKSGLGTLKDDIGNSYLRIRYEIPMKPKDRAPENAQLYPGAVSADVLVFEPPVSKAQTLYLELPGANVGENGAFRFRIPMATVDRK